MNRDSGGEAVQVIYVQKKDAKRVKNELERLGLLDRDFRLSPACDDRWKGCIAVPIRGTTSIIKLDGYPILAKGSQFCPYSTSVLGSGSIAKSALSLTQLALLQAVLEQNRSIQLDETVIRRLIGKLDCSVCPKSLEVVGDDRTLVVPRRALDSEEASLKHFLECISVTDTAGFMIAVWSSLARLYQSARVVRKGVVSPNSSVRESGLSILWPVVTEEKDNGSAFGPRSLAWITVTEQGIRQSFDLTRVMFSRGNISEKIRFGKLVQPGERILDMYAGIGYFVLPALVHGRAAHVVACEWNECALDALRYNLQDNSVADRATVLAGDCRVVAPEHQYFGSFDRVSLGLLPSSEGGWRVAVKALNRVRGGWMHVHGNVPSNEASQWTMWLCARLIQYVEDEFTDEKRCVIVAHLEKVKSFAPTVNHYVADVYVGPSDRCLVEVNFSVNCKGGVVDLHGFKPCPKIVDPPSCALYSDGPLHQQWMREVSMSQPSAATQLPRVTI